MINSRFDNLDIDLLELDVNNPRIAELLDRYKKEDITPEHIALALGTSEESYENLKNSIKENGGIINPIVVRKMADGKYLVIEGNTRVQIYKKFAALLILPVKSYKIKYFIWFVINLHNITSSYNKYK